MDRFSKVCLLLCVLLLAVIALRPFVVPPTAHAASQYTYLVVPFDPGKYQMGLQQALDMHTKDGWEFLTSINHERFNNTLMLIFRRER